MVGAAEERAHFAGADVGVGGDDAGDGMPGDVERDGLRAGERLEGAAIDVGDEVAEPIDQEDDAVRAARRSLSACGMSSRW